MSTEVRKRWFGWLAALALFLPVSSPGAEVSVLSGNITECGATATTLYLTTLFSGVETDATASGAFYHVFLYEGVTREHRIFSNVDVVGIDEFTFNTQINQILLEGSDLYDVNLTLSLFPKMPLGAIKFSLLGCNTALSLCGNISYFTLLINEERQVAGLSGEADHSLLNISWEPQDSGLETSYMVRISNQDESTLIDYVDCCNLTNTSYTLKLPQREPCTAVNYQARIAAVLCPSYGGVQPENYSAINVTAPANPDFCTLDVTEITDQPSGTQASYPSWLLVSATTAHLLLRIARPAF